MLDDTQFSDIILFSTHCGLDFAYKKIEDKEILKIINWIIDSNSYLSSTAVICKIQAPLFKKYLLTIGTGVITSG